MTHSNHYECEKTDIVLYAFYIISPIFSREETTEIEVGVALKRIENRHMTINIRLLYTGRRKVFLFVRFE